MEQIKAYLDNIRHYTGLENAYNEQLLQIRLIGYTAPISNYEASAGGGVGKKDSIEEKYIVALEKCEEQIKAKAIDYAQAVVKFFNEVEQIPSAISRLVLLAYYANHKSIKDIAKDLDKSESHTKKLLADAREDFAKIFKVIPNNTF